VVGDRPFGLQNKKSDILLVLASSRSSCPNDIGSFSGIHNGNGCR
jgi:hypothetical protein